MGLGYRYPRSEPATALAIAASRSSPSDHPSAVGVKIGEIPPNPTVRRDSLATKYSKTISRNHSTSLIVGSALRSSPTHGILPVPAPVGPCLPLDSQNGSLQAPALDLAEAKARFTFSVDDFNFPPLPHMAEQLAGREGQNPTLSVPGGGDQEEGSIPLLAASPRGLAVHPLDHHQGNGARPHLRPYMVPLLGHAGAASHQICCHEVPTILWEWRGTCTLSTT